MNNDESAGYEDLKTLGIEIPLPGGLSYSTKYPYTDKDGLFHFEPSFAIDPSTFEVFLCDEQDNFCYPAGGSL